MHPPEVKQAALELIEAGVNDCETGRRLGVSRSTVKSWRDPKYQRRSDYTLATCPRCWRATKPVRFTDADYCQALALYLGDGWISTHPRTQRLRIALDEKYPGIIEETAALLRRCLPENAVDVVDKSRPGCVNVSVYSTHLTCLFPQHGPGRKHTGGSCWSLGSSHSSSGRPGPSSGGASSPTGAPSSIERALRVLELRVLEQVCRHRRACSAAHATRSASDTGRLSIRGACGTCGSTGERASP